jgi:hypothetical protein
MVIKGVPEHIRSDNGPEMPDRNIGQGTALPVPAPAPRVSRTQPIVNVTDAAQRLVETLAGLSNGSAGPTGAINQCA